MMGENIRNNSFHRAVIKLKQQQQITEVLLMPHI
jgi:hypothetical protein